MQLDSGVPQSIRAGDTLKWTAGLSDYPAGDGWALKYYFVSKAAKFEIDAAQDGSTSGFVVNVAPATTSGYSAGSYRWVARVSKGSDVYTIAEGATEVVADISTAASGYDPRSQNQRILDAINALIEGRATSDVQSYKIHERELTKMSIQDLMYWRGIYLELVSAEESSRSGVPVRRIIKPVFRGRS